MDAVALTETTYVLEQISFEPDSDQLARQLRIKTESAQRAELDELIDKAASIAKPKAMYKLAFIDEKRPNEVVIDGVTLRSRVLRVNLGVAHRVFAYLITCGMELQTWSETFDDLLYRYWADAIKQAALGAATEALTRHLATCYRLGRTATMAPGSLADWPIQEQRALFRLLGDPQLAIGVVLTESCLMVPNKTVSGLRFPTEERFESCQLCPREACPGRRAAYEPELYKNKYR